MDTRKSPTSLRVVRPPAQAPAEASDALFDTSTVAQGVKLVVLLQALDACYVILDGEAAEYGISATGDRTVEPIRSLGRGSIAGAEYLKDLGVMGEDSQTEVVATTDLRVYRIDADQLFDKHSAETLRRERLNYVLRLISGDLVRTRNLLLHAKEKHRHDLLMIEAAEKLRREEAAISEERREDNVLLSREIVMLREQLERHVRELKERIMETESFREMNAALEESLDDERGATSRLIQSLAELTPRIERLQESPDEAAQWLGVYLLGLLSGLRMRLPS